MTADRGKQGRRRAVPDLSKRDKGVKGVFFITASKVLLWLIKIELKQNFYSFFFIFEVNIVVEQ